MAGQSTWNDPGSATNAYVVLPQLSKDIYIESEWSQIFGRMNGTRQVVTKEFGDGLKIDAGNDSPVWEKSLIENAECRFTLREHNEGMPNYGDASVKTGGFANWKHSVCYVRKVKSPAAQFPGFESTENFKRVAEDLVTMEKKGWSQWRSEEVELDAHRAALHGASRGLLLTTDGGKGITLAGGSAGEYRSPYNTYVAGQTGLTTPNYTRATHEATLSTLLVDLSDDSSFGFDYNEHRKHCVNVRNLKFKPVTIGGKKLIAGCIIDNRLLSRLTAYGGTVSTLFMNAYARGKDNPAVNHLEALELDGILYIPSKFLEYFRPTADGATITYGCGMTEDPRSSLYTNTSNICMAWYFGAGCLLRGKRKGGVRFTYYEEKHDGAKEIAMNYDDGWTRNDWVTRDGRTEIKNDNMLMAYYYDPGEFVPFANA
jgi:hypothetical protein